MNIAAWIGSLVVGSLLVGGVLESLRIAAEEPQPQIARTVFGHYDQSGIPGKEIVSGTVTLQPGAEVAFHVHPGDEAGHIVQGAVVLMVLGQPHNTLRAGPGFFNPRGSAHSLVAAERIAGHL